MKTINNPNPIGKMKTINNPNPIASIGRISFKKIISAILLFSLLLFFLLAGANSLQAQERKTGWFVGLSPYAMDLNLEKTTRQTTRQTTRRTTDVSSIVEDIIYDATVPNFASDAAHWTKFSISGALIAARLLIAITAGEDAIQLCREGAVPVIATGDDDGAGNIATPDTISLNSYDGTTEDITDGLSQLLTNTPPTTSGTSTSDQARCKDFFETNPPPPTPSTSTNTSTSDEESSKTQKSSKTQSLQGTGIEFGYDFEKYSLSFNQLQWSGGDDKLQAQMLLFRYFLPYALSVGGGFASAKLDTEFGSDSGTVPVFHFGYDYPITKNFQISLSYAWLGVNLAVQDTQSVTTTPAAIITTTPTTPSSIQKRAIISLVRRGGDSYNDYYATRYQNNIFDTRIVVTATIPTEVTTVTEVTEATVQETTTIQNTEIKNLSTIKIGFRYSF